MTRRIPLSLSVLLTCATGLLNSANAAPPQSTKPDLPTIFSQFVVASVAATQCSKPSKATLDHFRANYNLVAVATANDIAKRNPKLSRQQIEQVMKKRAATLAQKVSTVIKQKGCKDSGIVQLVESFDAQAKWNPRKTAHTSAGKNEK